MSANLETTDISLHAYMERVGINARAASRLISRAEAGAKNDALNAIADHIESSVDALREANQKDMDAGEKNGLSPAMLDRLELTPDRISAMAEGLRQVATLADPVGQITDLQYRPSGI